jgi:hypothetical protein
MAPMEYLEAWGTLMGQCEDPRKNIIFSFLSAKFLLLTYHELLKGRPARFLPESGDIG